jgi:hypothetical protein
MKFTLTESICLLQFVLEELEDQRCVLSEASKLTPYQKAQRNRRQTVASHSPRPAKQSKFYKHAVSAIFKKLRKNGESFKGSSKGGQLIAQWMLKKHGYANGDMTGNFKLTSKGHSRNRKHTSEPSGISKRKDKSYDYIMGIQRRKKARQQQVQQKAASAG